MKKILITGKNSFIGTSFEHYISKKDLTKQFQIDVLDTLEDSWKIVDFSKYDTVFHVAGIAHSDKGKISKDKETLYYKVNTDLAINIANKAKFDGVNQFIFMSSSIVYGECSKIGRKKIVDLNTPLNPQNFYSKSKVMAEKGILDIEDENFKVVILRPPMVYGNHCKGNYPILSKFAKTFPFFPYIDNMRSMIHIDNLCEFIRLMIANDEHGIFLPQNAEYTNTSLLVKYIAQAHNKNIFLIRGFKHILLILSYFTPLINKVFGNFCYETEASKYKENYQLLTLQESIDRTEKV